MGDEIFMKIKWFIVVLVLLMTGGFLFFRISTIKKEQPTDNRLQIVASFYPVAEFARVVGGNLVDVKTITHSGIEPHEYEPTAQQIKTVYGSDVFLFNGGGIDVWAERLAPQLPKSVRVVELSSIVEKIIIDQKTGTFDPHIWLDPIFAAKEVVFIEQILATIDPKHSEQYQKNAQAYIKQLSVLDSTYKIGLSQCKNRTIITAHATLAYLAKRYSFEVLTISGLSPEAEPSAGRFAEIATVAKEKGINAIYFETLASPKLSETLAREIGAVTLVFDPLEGLSAVDQQNGKNYLSVMQNNLKNLKIGMVCQ